MWSIGNEVLEQWSDIAADTLDMQQANTLLNFAGRNSIAGGGEIDTTFHVNALLTQKLADMVRALDPTRPVTAGNNETRPFNHLLTSGALDVIGFNYHETDWLTFPDVYPGEKLIVTESTSALASRGWYGLGTDTTYVWPVRWDLPFDRPVHHCPAYDNCHVPWGSTHETALRLLRDKDLISGIYVCTGFDYLGEPTPFWWPSRSSYFGIVDLAGFPKDAYYLYMSEWTTGDVLHIFPHWNWNEGDTVDVWAYYNNADEVELTLNGRSLGRRAKEDGAMHVSWPVPFEAGVLTAVSYRNGREVLRREVRTAGPAAAVRLTPDRTRIEGDGRDLSFVTVEVVDAAGVALPTADHLVRFTVEGGEIVGTDNGDPTDPASLSRPERHLFAGKALAVVKAPGRGEIKLTATIEGVGQTSTTIRAR
jgi:beta-galactosidase